MSRELALAPAPLPVEDRPQVPRHSPEAEISVLGAAFDGPDAALRVVEGCARDDLHAARHRLIWDAFAALVQRRQAVDPVTVSEELRTRGTFEEVGGGSYLAQLLDAVPTAANLDYHLRIVREKAARRRLLDAAATIEAWGRYRDAPVEQMLDEAGAALFAIGESEARGGFVGVKDLLWGAMERVEARGKLGSGVTGVASGFSDLDAITAGFQKGDLIVLGARPSQGKTALALGIAQHAALGRGEPVAVFSLEMGKEALVERMLASEARVDGQRIRTGRLKDDDYPRLAHAAGLLNAAPIYIDDTGALTVLQLRARARRLRAQCPDLALIVVDYLQLMTGEGENRTQVVSAISRGLKALAKELDVPVLALSQLSRSLESRPDKRPMLSDLRESGQVEQDADLVMFLYRPEVYYGPVDKDGNSLEGRAELIIGKQRNGATGTVPLMFHKEFTRFENYSSRREAR